MERQRFNVQMQQNNSCQKKMGFYSKMIEKYNVAPTANHQMWTSLWKSNFDVNMQNLLSDELSLFEDKKAFNEVLNNQKLIEEKKKQSEQEKLRQQQEQAKREKDKANEQIKLDQRKVETQLKEKDKIFKKLCKVTRVTELDKIIPLKNELDAGNHQLNEIKNFVQEQIEEHQSTPSLLLFQPSSRSRRRPSRSSSTRRTRWRKSPSSSSTGSSATS